MKVRFLHNRKTSVINTEQIFIGLSWQYAASSFPLLNQSWKLQGQMQQEESKEAVAERWDEGHWHVVNADILQVRQREHCEKFSVIWGSLKAL